MSRIPLAFIGMPSGMEWLIVLFVALLLFGRRLPSVMRGLGSSLREFKSGLNEATPTDIDGKEEAPVPPALPPVSRGEAAGTTIEPDKAASDPDEASAQSDGAPVGGSAEPATATVTVGDRKES